MHGVTCEKDTTNLWNDANCFIFSAQGKCTQCAYKYVFNNQGLCTLVSPDCKTWDQAGACLSCFDGFVLNIDLCTKLVLSAPIPTLAVP